GVWSHLNNTLPWTDVRLDALSQQHLLEETFSPAPRPHTPNDTPEPSQPAAPAAVAGTLKTDPGIFRRRALKAALGIGVAAAVGWLPAQRIFELSSSEAVVNARVITVRAPIDGQIEVASGLPEVGSPVAANTVLLRVVNARADRGRLDDLRRLKDSLESERAGLGARLTVLRSQYDDLIDQTRYFQQARVRQLEARVAEIESDIAAAAARRTEAISTLNRTTTLVQSGAQTKAALERAERDGRVTE